METYFGQIRKSVGLPGKEAREGDERRTRYGTSWRTWYLQEDVRIDVENCCIGGVYNAFGGEIRPLFDLLCVSEHFLTAYRVPTQILKNATAALGTWGAKPLTGYTFQERVQHARKNLYARTFMSSLVCFV